jgi:hypothetical protein
MTDVKYFDKEFVDMPTFNSLETPSGALRAEAASAPSPVATSPPHFEGFTYVPRSELAARGMGEVAEEDQDDDDDNIPGF